MSIQDLLKDDEKLYEISGKVFDQIDTDNNSFINKQDLGKAMRLFAHEGGFKKPSEAEINQALNGLDTNLDGKVGKHDFKNYIKGMLESLVQN